MSIADRIEQAPACEVINLSESEKDIYCGSGWKLARFENGVLTGFFNPKDTPYRSDVQAMATEAVNNRVPVLFVLILAFCVHPLPILTSE